MLMTQVITGFSRIALALTPTERWNAMGRFSGGSRVEWLPEVVGGIVLAVLVVVLFVWILRSRRKRDEKDRRLTFGDRVKQMGLSERECQLLVSLAEKAGLRQVESIFTIATAFDRGSEKMMEDLVAVQHDPEDVERLKVELSFLREKLGFKARPSNFATPAVGTHLSSRQIPIGKKLYLTRTEGPGPNNVEGTVVQNSDSDIRIRLSGSIETDVGDIWSVQCYSGASIWQFDASVIDSGGMVLTLNHTGSVKFSNRRRFPRIPVNKPAFMARFSFAVTPVRQAGVDRSGEKYTTTNNRRQSNVSRSERIEAMEWGPPEFVPAVLTELAGPGLRIESVLSAYIGDYVLIVLGLDEKGDRQHTEQEDSDEQTPGMMLEDVGIVRHVKRVTNGWSLAIELIGLSDANVDELIHETNAAGIRLHAGDKASDVSESVEEASLIGGS